MVDSRDKGMRAEYAVRDLLRAKTGLDWERVPGSGAYGKQHGLKGDIYLPVSTGKMSYFCIEVKHYAKDVINSELLKVNKNPPTLWSFWEQTIRESYEMNMKPILIFKKDRGQWLCGVKYADLNVDVEPMLTFCHDSHLPELVIVPFDIWLNNNKDKLYR